MHFCFLLSYRRDDCSKVWARVHAHWIDVYRQRKLLPSSTNSLLYRLMGKRFIFALLAIAVLTHRGPLKLWRILMTKATLTHSTACTSQDDGNRKTADIILNGFGVLALLFVRTIIGKLAAMLIKLDSWYETKSAASRIAKLWELFSTRYRSLNEYMLVHVACLDGLVAHLKSMGRTPEDHLAFDISGASIDVTGLLPVIRSAKTFSISNIKWKNVASRPLKQPGQCIQKFVLQQ